MSKHRGKPPGKGLPDGSASPKGAAERTTVAREALWQEASEFETSQSVAPQAKPPQSETVESRLDLSGPDFGLPLASGATMSLPEAMPNAPSFGEGGEPSSGEVGASSLGGAGIDVVPSSMRDVLGDRYAYVRMLGGGGFGEVHLVHDQQLGRSVAMKILRPRMGGRADVRARFLAEIHLTARLSHPGIVAVYDAGSLESGQLWYTMPEVRGRTFRDVVDAAFTGDQPHRRLIDLYARACDAVAYAHGKKIVHRDLKPDNIMIGEHGEVLVMDWGIAHLHDDLELLTSIPPSSEPDLSSAPLSPPLPALAPLHTRAGTVLGTPGYMAPEQARGAPDLIGPATDVYAMGALLLFTLTAERPRPSRRDYKVSETLKQQLAALDSNAEVPFELAAICRRAMAFEPADRYPNAEALAQEVRAFLEGALRRDLALAKLAQAQTQAQALDPLRARVAAARAAALQAMTAVRPSDPVERKAPGWALESRAEQLERELALGEAEWIQLVQGALAKDPSLPEAHEALASYYCDKLVAAERAGPTADAIRFEVLLRAHDRGRYAAVLSGEGALTMLTEPPHAEATLQRYAPQDRRLVVTAQRSLKSSQRGEIPLQAGSYLLKLRAPGHAEIRYPVVIERGGRWNGCAPGQLHPTPIVLPSADAIDADEVLVPAGWSWVGGDPDAADSLPRRRVWIDAFVMRRHPVTYAELIGLLNDMLAAGLSDAELGFPAAGPGLSASAALTPALAQDANGQFVLVNQDAVKAEPLRQARWPASVTWWLAAACARFVAQRSQRPYRLPNELEREKACRGVDGRFFAWGDQAEPVFACSLEGQRHEPLPQPVEAHPTDESPYGLRGLCGNMRDWCGNLWQHDGPRVENHQLVLESAPPDSDDFRAVRGGAWGSSIVHARAAARFASRPGVRQRFVGFRLVRSWPN